MDRREWVLAGHSAGGLGLEIGPGNTPFVADDPQLRVKTLDHRDQAGLIAKYENLKLDTSRIRPVDYVWSGERYADLVGDTRFDWILASHVIEHVPDLIGFINECGEILASGGRLSLFVPDRRCEFDYFRPCSGLGSVIDAHLQERRRSSPGLAAEFALYASQLDGQDTWAPDGHADPQLRFSDSRASSLMGKAQAQYVDIHAWVFTPHSLRLIVEDAYRLGLLKLRETAFHTDGAFEFYIQLSADGAGPGMTRQELCRKTLEEAGAPRAPEAPGLPDLGLSDPNVSAAMAENAGLRREIEALHNSTSWRLTAPVRAVRHALNRALGRGGA